MFWMNRKSELINLDPKRTTLQRSMSDQPQRRTANPPMTAVPIPPAMTAQLLMMTPAAAPVNGVRLVEAAGLDAAGPDVAGLDETRLQAPLVQAIVVVVADPAPAGGAALEPAGGAALEAAGGTAPEVAGAMLPGGLELADAAGAPVGACTWPSLIWDTMPPEGEEPPEAGPAGDVEVAPA